VIADKLFCHGDGVIDNFNLLGAEGLTFLHYDPAKLIVKPLEGLVSSVLASGSSEVVTTSFRKKSFLYLIIYR
jgi:hypothetical protein